MSLLPVSHFTWQVLRTAKRSGESPTGRSLRVAMNRRSQDGTFLTKLVKEGLLDRVAGSADAPFEATYSLTPLGEYAAEYGEYDHDRRLVTLTLPPPPPPEKAVRINPELLIGHWRPRHQPEGGGRTIEFTGNGEMVDRTRVGQRYSSSLYRYRVEGNKLVVRRGGTERPPLTIADLADTELVIRDKDGREERFERIKGRE